LQVSYQFLSPKEPIGSVSPKVNAGEDLKSVKGELKSHVNLLCPAQAYPTPVFRYFSLSFAFELRFSLCFAANFKAFYSLKRTNLINATENLLR